MTPMVMRNWYVGILEIPIQPDYWYMSIYLETCELDKLQMSIIDILNNLFWGFSSENISSYRVIGYVGISAEC